MYIISIIVSIKNTKIKIEWNQEAYIFKNLTHTYVILIVHYILYNIHKIIFFLSFVPPEIL